MTRTELSPSRYDLKIDLSTDDAVSELSSGVFSETGLVVTLEASDFDSLDQVSFSIDVVVEFFRGNLKKLEFTMVFTEYINLIRVVSGYDLYPRWSKSDVLALESQVVEFKTVYKDVFGNY